MVCFLGMILARASPALVAGRTLSLSELLPALPATLPPMVALGYPRGILLWEDPKHRPVQTVALLYSHWPALP